MMRARHALVILSLLPSGCIRWGLGEARGYEAARGIAAAEAQVASAESIDRIVSVAADTIPRETADAIMAEAHGIRRRALDDAQLARIRLMDHGYTPDAQVALSSPEDAEQLNGYSGMAASRDSRRRAGSRVGGLLGRFVASIADKVIERYIPAPVQWTLWISLIGSILGAAVAAIWRVLRWALRERTVADDAHDQIADLIAAARERGASSDELAEIARRHPHARARHAERRLAGTAD